MPKSGIVEAYGDSIFSLKKKKTNLLAINLLLG